MTQISAMLLNNASLVDTSAIQSSPLQTLFIVAFAVLALCIISSIILDRRKKQTLSPAVFFTGFLITISLVLIGITLHAKSYQESEKVSNTKIAQFIQAKYGVTVLNDQNIGADIRDNTTLTPLSIPAKAPNGERIQITIELSEDDTDVLAFSSGAEMKKISE